jgi:hypothetical protein
MNKAAMNAGKQKEYVHLPLNAPMEMGASSYWISAEERVPFLGREILCIIRDTECITSCCGESPGLRSIGVLGYIISWHARISDGRPISLVEPIVDEAQRTELSRLLRGKYRIAQVEFL